MPIKFKDFVSKMHTILPPIPSIENWHKLDYLDKLNYMSTNKNMSHNDIHTIIDHELPANTLSNPFVDEKQGPLTYLPRLTNFNRTHLRKINDRINDEGKDAIFYTNMIEKRAIDTGNQDIHREIANHMYKTGRMRNLNNLMKYKLHPDDNKMFTTIPNIRQNVSAGFL